MPSLLRLASVPAALALAALHPSPPGAQPDGAQRDSYILTFSPDGTSLALGNMWNVSIWGLP